MLQGAETEPLFPMNLLASGLVVPGVLNRAGPEQSHWWWWGHSETEKINSIKTLRQ